MRHPKHRTTIYVLTRQFWNDLHTHSAFTVLDSFYTLERAEEVAEIFRKEAKESGVEDYLFFEVMASTYYDL